MNCASLMVEEWAITHWKTTLKPRVACCGWPCPWKRECYLNGGIGQEAKDKRFKKIKEERETERTEKTRRFDGSSCGSSGRLVFSSYTSLCMHGFSEDDYILLRTIFLKTLQLFHFLFLLPTASTECQHRVEFSSWSISSRMTYLVNFVRETRTVTLGITRAFCTSVLFLIDVRF